MLCLISAIVFAILGIFSASHRQLAKEAFICVFNRVTMRPCTTNVGERTRAQVTGFLLTKSPAFAKFVHKYFELMAWILFILSMVSTFFVVRGLYNFYMYGSCNGLNESGFCVFDPSGSNNKVTQFAEPKVCTADGKIDPNSVKLAGLDLSNYPKKTKKDAKNEIVFIGCYECEFTRKSYPEIKKLVEKKSANLTFIHFPVKSSPILSNYVYCTNKIDSSKFWNFNDKMFSAKTTDLEKIEYVDQLVSEAGYNSEEVKSCVNNAETQTIVDKQIKDTANTGIFGTPTIFINKNVYVGPKPYRVYERALK